jgi:hypothetical protein
MKFSNIFIFTYLVIGGFIGLFYFYEQTHLFEKYEELIFAQIAQDGNDRIQRVELYLEDVNTNLNFLSETDEIINFFERKTKSNDNDAYNDLKQKVDKVILDLENYAINNPKLTLDELLIDEGFNDIALEVYGDDGYTVITDENFTIKLHKYSKYVGIDITEIENISPVVADIFVNLYNNGGQNYGFYPWVDQEGFDRDKYIFCKHSKQLNLIVCPTAYLDDYDEDLWFANVYEDELIQFQKGSGFKNIILVENNGNVIWSSNKDKKIPDNLINNNKSRINIEYVFEKLKNINSPKTGVFLKGHNNITEIFTTIKIFSESNEILGYLIIELDENQLKNKIGGENLNEDIEVFLFSSNNDVIITDSQELITFNINDICNNKSVSEPKFFTFENNKFHKYTYVEKIEDSSLCLYFSINNSFIEKIFHVVDKNKLSITLILLFSILLTIGLIVSYILELKFKLVRNKKKNKNGGMK